MQTFITHEFEIGQIVYLRADEEQQKRCIVSMKVFKGGELLYELVRAGQASYHYDFEISAEKIID